MSHTRVLLAGCFLVLLSTSSALAAQKVAVLGASGLAPGEIHDKLVATGAFSLVDQFDVSSDTPTLATLQTYDAVIVVSNISFADPAAMGDTLAAYLEGGGGVVLSDFRALVTDDSPLDGRYVTDYALMTPDVLANVVTTEVSLGMVLEPGSPLLDGVVKFGPATGSTINHLSTAVQHGGVVVAQFSDGTPMILRGSINGHTVVELNFMAASTDSVGDWDPTTDGAKIMVNALNFVTSPLVASPASVEFPATAVGTMATAKTVTFKNTSGAPLTVMALNATGPAAADFPVTPSTTFPATLPAGGMFTVQLGFSPTSVGKRQASLQADIMGASPSLVTVVGTSTGPQLTATPTSVDLGFSAIGMPLSGIVRITNTGNLPLIVTGATITTDAASFSVMPNAPLPATLAPGDKRDLIVSFASMIEGQHDGVITVTSSTAFVPPLAIPVTALTGSPKILVPAMDVVCDAAHAGSSSGPKTVHITNSGFSNLSVTSMTIGGTDATDFSVTAPPFTIVVPPGMGFDLAVTFHPATTGAKAASVTLGSNDPMAPAASFNVTGTAAAFDETFDPATTLDFGSVAINSTVSKDITITNNSAVAFNVTSMALSGADMARFTLSRSAPFSVDPMSSTTMTVTFAPLAKAAAVASVDFGTDDPAKATLSIALTGMGAQGEFTLTPTMIDFGDVVQGFSSPTQMVTVKNTGAADLSITEITLGGAQMDQYAIAGVPTLPAALAAGASIDVMVTFSPTKVELANGNLSFLSADGLTGGVPLKGNGIDSFLGSNPPSIDFGAIPVGATSSSMPITVKNNSAVDQMVTGIAVTGPFQVDGPTTATLHPGDTISLKATFSPTTGGLAESDIAIAVASVTTGPVKKIHLRGTGASATVTVTPDHLVWPQIFVGETGETFTVTVVNTSLLPLSLALTPGSDEFVVDMTGTKLTLGLDETTRFKVTYQPKNSGHASSLLVLVVAGSTESAAVIKLDGDALEKGSGCGCFVAGRTGGTGAAGAGALGFSVLAGAGAAAWLVSRRRRRDG